MSLIDFFGECLNCEEVNGKRVLEVGSKYVNGSVRPIINQICHPREYLGVDMSPGKYVDLVMPAEDLVSYFGSQTFDIVISTEMLEHVRDWRRIINNLKIVLKDEGILYLTTRSLGFPYHAYPHDYWRYSVEDFKEIFDDFQTLLLKSDPEAPGVFFKGKKKQNEHPKDLLEIELYSVLLGQRTKNTPAYNDAPVLRRTYFRVRNSISTGLKVVLEDMTKNPKT